MIRQGSAAEPPWGDSLPDQANLIRDLIPEELRRGMGRCSRCSEREGSASSSSQEGSRSSQSHSFRHCPRAPSHTRCSRSPSRRLNRSRVSPRSSTFWEVALPPLPGISTFLSGLPCAHLAHCHPLGYRQPSVAVASSYIRSAASSAASSLHVSLSLCFAGSSKSADTVLSIDDASSLL